VTAQCPKCNGTGRLRNFKCGTCGGSGEIKRPIRSKALPGPLPREIARRELLKAARAYAATFATFTEAPAFHAGTTDQELQLALTEADLETAARVWAQAAASLVVRTKRGGR
jgi:hypothetical protein